MSGRSLVWSPGVHLGASDVTYVAEDPSPLLRHGVYRIRRDEGDIRLFYERWRDEQGGAVPIQHIGLGGNYPSVAAAKSTAEDHHRAILSAQEKARRSEARGPARLSERVFSGVFPTGIGYADRTVEVRGDYNPLAFLPFSTLELEWRAKRVPADVRAYIEADARKIQARRGEQYQVSGAGQTVLLGSSTARKTPAEIERDVKALGIEMARK